MERSKHPISTLSFEQISKCLVVDKALVLLRETYTYELSLRIAPSIVVIPIDVLFISRACKLRLPPLLKNRDTEEPKFSSLFPVISALGEVSVKCRVREISNDS